MQMFIDLVIFTDVLTSRRAIDPFPAIRRNGPRPSGRCDYNNFIHMLRLYEEDDQPTDAGDKSCRGSIAARL